MSSKEDVRAFWEKSACGETLLLDAMDADGFDRQSQERYRLEPFIEPFARFEECRGRAVLEVGLGLGADHQRFAEAGAKLSGVDLTERAVSITRERLRQRGLASDVRVGDAEQLSFSDDTFDVVYSWGVIHHSPNTVKAVDEIARVLKPGGLCRVMIYHKYSLVGLMLWVRYGLLRFRPLTPLAEIYSNYLESPGTKAYSKREAQSMFSAFRNVRITIELTHGDLLASGAGQRHQGSLLNLARKIWPRRILAKLAKGFGLFMLIEGTKPLA